MDRVDGGFVRCSPWLGAHVLDAIQDKSDQSKRGIFSCPDFRAQFSCGDLLQCQTGEHEKGKRTGRFLVSVIDVLQLGLQCF